MIADAECQLQLIPSVTTVETHELSISVWNVDRCVCNFFIRVLCFRRLQYTKFFRNVSEKSFSYASVTDVRQDLLVRDLEHFSLN